MVFFSQKRAISSLAVVAIGTTLRREEGTGSEGGTGRRGGGGLQPCTGTGGSPPAIY